VNVDDLDDNPIFVKTIKDKNLLQLQAFETYKKSYNRSNVPNSFVVPSNNSIIWPISTWGMKLGTCFRNMNNEGYHKHLHVKFEAMGYDLQRRPK
jgi:hypothetical protein